MLFSSGGGGYCCLALVGVIAVSGGGGYCCLLVVYCVVQLLLRLVRGGGFSYLVLCCIVLCIVTNIFKSQRISFRLASCHYGYTVYFRCLTSLEIR